MISYNGNPRYLELFGQIRLTQGQRVTTQFRLQKAALLLAYLALHSGRNHTRERLIDLLWPEVEINSGRKSLTTALASLRREFESAEPLSGTPVHADRQSINLDETQLTTDVARFDLFLKQAHSTADVAERAALLEQAVALYRGELLERFYDDWVLTLQSAYRQRFHEALLDLAEDHETLSDWTSALAVAERAVANEPLNEQAVVILMRVQARQGRAAAALTAFDQLRARLRDAFDVEPGPEPVRLAAMLRSDPRALAPAAPAASAPVAPTPALSGDDASQPRPRTNLPNWLTSFVARDEEIGQVRGLLSDHRLLTLTGMGGCGKTRLAVELGKRLMEEYPDGVWLIELAALADPLRVPDAVAQALEIDEISNRTVQQTLVDVLRDRRALLILDNCEHLLSACAHLSAHLLRTCGRLTILATSREPLLVYGEQTYRVPTLSVPDVAQPISRESLLEFSAPRLFVERAMQVRPDFRLTDDNAPALARICRRLDGIPLAIELAAARLRSLAPIELDRRLDDRFGMLIGGDRTALPRQRTMRALFDWSYDLLSEEEKRLFLRLAVFSGGWTLGAAEAVCTFDTEKGAFDRPSLTLDLLTGLVDKSLVIAETRGELTRYRMLESMRQYAWERLSDTEARHAIQTRHRDYFLEFAETMRPGLNGQEQADALNRLEAELDNFRRAADFSAAQPDGASSGMRLACALYQLWKYRGHLSEGRRRLTEALAHPSPPDLRLREERERRAEALGGIGVLTYLQGDYPLGRNALAEALALQRELGDQNGVADCLNNLGNILQAEGDYAEARACHEEALALRRKLNNRYGVACSLGNLGTIARDVDDLENAVLLNQASLDLFRELGNERNLAYSLNNLANAYEGLSDFRLSRALHEESREIERRIGDRWAEANSILNLGQGALYQGDLERAKQHFTECLEMYTELQDQQGIALCLHPLGVVLIEEEDVVGGLAALGESLASMRKLGNRRGIAFVLHALGRAALLRNELVPAAALLQEALEVRRELGASRLIAATLCQLAVVAAMQGRCDTAREPLWESLIRQRDAKDRYGIAESLLVRAELALQEGDAALAALLLGATASLRREIACEPFPSERVSIERIELCTREALGDSTYESACSHGASLDWKAAVAAALDEPAADA